MKGYHLAIPTLALAAACGGPPEPARFSGHVKRRVASADEIRETPARPAGYVTLGTVTSSCVDRDPSRRLEKEWLKDVACSEALLVRALREKAASVGGQILVDRQCTADRDKDEGVIVTDHQCTARVARSSAAGRSRTPAGRLPEHRDDILEVPARDAWRIAVDFIPTSKDQTGRTSRRPDVVEHLPYLTPSYVVYGDISARCEEGCARDSVKDAVRATAARVGADGVTGIACAESHESFTCTGHAAVYSVDPRTHRAAR